MSLIPSLFHSRDYYDPWEVMYPRRHSWDDFGLGVTLPEIQMFSEMPLRSTLRKGLNALKKSGGLVPHVGKDGFQVSLDVHQFLPSEISVKAIENTVVIEGKHEERQDDHGIISRHFIRKYNLPQGYDSKDVHSALSSDGFLTIKAPPPSKELTGKERVIEIQHTGPAHLHLKDVSKEEKQKDVVATTNG